MIQESILNLTKSILALLEIKMHTFKHVFFNTCKGKIQIDYV